MNLAYWEKRTRFYVKRLAGAVLLLLTAAVAAGEGDEEEYARRRHVLVDAKLAAQGVSDPRVLEAARSVPRHLFVPDYARARAYDDVPLPLGDGQFDPPPSLSARIAQAIAPTGEDTVLVVGVGSGYLCALLSALSFEVAVSEIDQGLWQRAREVFQALKLGNIQIRLRDGYYGWEPSRLFDHIIVNGAVNHIPEPLLAALRVGGKMIVPLGNLFGVQNLLLVTKTEEGTVLQSLDEVIFAPLKGRALDQSDKKEYPPPHAEQGDFTLARFRPAPRAR